MENREYRQRLIDAELRRYLNTFGAVCLEGPKWCGKTWTCKNLAKSEFELADPRNNFQNRALAKIDLNAALDGEKPHLIDEWQEIPEIWDAVRFAVDKKNENGLFLMCGSSTPRQKGILHSGAGRIARLRMRTMSLFELGKSSGKVSLADIAAGKIETQLTGDVTLKQLAGLVVRGGWPAQFRAEDGRGAELFAREYISALLDDDLNRLEDRRRNPQKMERLLRSLARNESTTASVSTIVSDLYTADGKSMDDETVTDYLDALRRMFVTENQKPFGANVRSSVRIKQAEKLHFADPSMACALLNLTDDMLMGDLRTFGLMFEALCTHDLRIYAETGGGKLFHYQNYRNREIDAVVELSDGRWGGFEIKLGANQIDAAAENLLKIQKEFGDEPNFRAPSFLCVICGMSNAAYTRPDGVTVVPLTALKN